MLTCTCPAKLQPHDPVERVCPVDLPVRPLTGPLDRSETLEDGDAPFEGGPYMETY